MKRRAFVISAIICLAAPAGFAQTDILRETFESMPEMERRFIQLELQMMELYAGALDTRFGPMTRAGLLMAADLIASRTNGDISFDLDSADDVQRYLSMMAQEQFMFIYDDGYEG